MFSQHFPPSQSQNRRRLRVREAQHHQGPHRQRRFSSRRPCSHRLPNRHLHLQVLLAAVLANQVRVRSAAHHLPTHRYLVVTRKKSKVKNLPHSSRGRHRQNQHSENGMVVPKHPHRRRPRQNWNRLPTRAPRQFLRL